MSHGGGPSRITVEPGWWWPLRSRSKEVSPIDNRMADIGAKPVALVATFDDAQQLMIAIEAFAEAAFTRDDLLCFCGTRDEGNFGARYLATWGTVKKKRQIRWLPEAIRINATSTNCLLPGTQFSSFAEPVASSRLVPLLKEQAAILA